MIHRINVFILSVILTLSQVLIINSANAAALGGWSMGNPVAVGASTVYEGTKQVIIDGKNYIKTGTAKITPVASQVSKVLARGAAGVALSVAVEQLLGAVDWVLDPANNQIKYRITSPDDPSNFQYRWRWHYDLPQFDCYSLSSCLAAGNAYHQYMVDNKLSSPDGQVTYSECHFSGVYIQCSGTVKYDGSYRDFTMVRFSNPAYNPEADTEEKTIPLDVVSAQVISNAEGDTDKKAAAQVVTTSAAADIVAEAETDETKARPITDQLNKSASTKPADSDAAANAGTGTATATPQADPVTGEQSPPTDISLEFPVFCDWVPVVCEAAQVVVVTVPATIDAVKEWVKPEEPAPAETKVDIEQSPVPPSESNYLQWNAYCPFTAKSDEISINGETSALSSDLTSWCTMASEIKPFVLLAGALASLMIVSGVGLGRGDD